MIIVSNDVTILVGGDAAVAEKWIRKAETRLRGLLRRRGVSLDDLVADPGILPEVKDVLENAVLRVLRNPDGARSESEGDYSVTHNPLDAAGSIWFPAADIDRLAPQTSRVGTIRLGLTPERSFGRIW